MDRSGHKLRDAAAVALLFLLVTIFTWRISLAGRVLAGGDIFTYFHPYWAEATRAIRAGRLPLWNPYLFMGVPLVANSQVGFFYPLNWPLWLLLPAHRSVHATIVMHLCLAAVNAYAWGRKTLGLGRLGSWTVGATFALGGYLGAQLEHVNQLQGLAWLPLLLMLAGQIVHYDVSHLSGGTYDVGASPAAPGRSRLRGSCALAVVIAFVLLAGHTQTAFISLFGTAVYALVPTVWKSFHDAEWRVAVRRAAPLAGGAILGVAVAAIQLLPTRQLSRLSVRAKGLPFNERVSFSLSPLYMGRALLPAYGHAVPPHHLEHVAYLGAIGVALAVLGLACDFRRRRTKPERDRAARNAVYLLVLVGLFFAFGLYNPLYVLLARYVPGFAHFRVPARWLALYGIGTAAMAGHAIQTLWESKAPGGRDLLTVAAALAVLILWAVIGSLLGGMDELYLLSVVGWVGASLSAMGLLLAASRISRAATVGLLALLTVELFLASRALPQTRATAPQAFTSLRPAVAHLLASISPAGAPPSRFLSMSDTTFDPGDLSLIRTIYEPQLSNDELYDYIVASKQKEVMSPNLPLAFGVPAVDGYDGGVLPLQRYVALERAFLSGQEVSMDGRLRENLKAIPQGRWLNLFNVRYVITDKLRDAWIDDVFYDLQFGARLSGGESATVGDVPRFEATALGVVSHLEGGAALPQGAPVGIATLRFADGDTAAFTLLAGEDVREAAVEQVSRETATARLSWPEPRTPVTVNVEAIEPGVTWVVRGLSLIDERTGSFQSLVVSGEGHFRMIHSGDVKIYENVDALPRAFTVAHARVASDAEEAREAMMDPMVDLSSEVVLERGGSCKGPTADSADLAEPSSGELPVSGSARIVSYQPERVVVRAGLDRPGYLVLTDAFYPGWQATVDGERASICQADLLFRALPLEPGNHRVVFRFRPPLQRVGAAISGLGLLLLLAAWHERRIVETVVRCYNRMQT